MKIRKTLLSSILLFLKAFFVVLIATVQITNAQTTVTYNTATTHTFTVPAGVTSVTVEAWGGGGAGGGQNRNSDGGGGGGGGAYSKKSTVTVVSGNSYDVVVGAGGIGVAGGDGGDGGDSYFNNKTIVLAKGGYGGKQSSGTPPVGGAGGSATECVGVDKYSGGQGEIGRDDNSGQGGYGGSSAGTGAIGFSGPQLWNTITYPTANTPAGGGRGGNGGGANNNGSAGTSPGGGGGGSGDGSPKLGGNGAAGKVIITYTCPSYSISGITGTSACTNPGTSTITVTSTPAGLPVGTYTVTYSRSVPYATNLKATMQVTTAGTGTFTATGLTSAGSRIITITSLGSGSSIGTDILCSSSINSNNTATVVVTSGVPSQPSVISGNISLCEGSTEIYSVTNVNGVVYNWQLPAGWTQTGGGNSNSITVTVGSSPGTIRVTPSNGCGPGTSRTLSVSVNSINILGFPGSRCGAGTGVITLSAWASSGTINWYDSDGDYLYTGTTYTTPVLNTTTTYYIDATNSSCTSARIPVTAYIITPPSLTASGSGTYCSGTNVNLSSTLSGADNVYWEGPNGYYSVLGNPVLTNVTPSMSGSYTATSSALSGINLITNGDFEAGRTGFDSDYTYKDSTAAGTWGALSDEGTYTVVSNPRSGHINFSACADHSVPGKKQLVVNGTTKLGDNIWTQTVNVVPGTYYQFTYWIQSVVALNPSQLLLYVNHEFVGIVYEAKLGTCEWTQFLYNWYSGTNTSAILELKNQNINSDGNDFALDDIVFQHTCTSTASVNITVNDDVTSGNIGTSQTICNGTIPSTLTSGLTGTGSGTITYEWETNASGSYVAIPGATTASYSPPALNSTTSYRRRTVSNSGGVTCYSGYTNIVTITVGGPTVIAGNPITICQSSSPTEILLTGASYGGLATSAAWSIISGGGSLSSTDQTATPADVTYTPAANNSGIVVLRLTTSASPCSAISERIITIVPSATAVAGTPVNTCSNSGAVDITSGSEATNFSSVLWTSNGTGTFTNANSLTLATYTPSSTEIANGEVTITLTAYGNSPCGEAVSTKTLTIHPDGSWTGTVDRDWNKPDNWACNQLPTLTTNVTIASGLTNYPIVSSTSPAGMARDISIGNGASVTVTGGKLQIAGNITNNGTFTATEGTIEMKGSAEQNIWANVFATNTLMNLIINNVSGVILHGALDITGVVSPVIGNLSSEGHLTLLSTAGQTALIDGSGLGNVTGIVNMQRYLPRAFGYKYFSSPFEFATVGAFTTLVDLTETFPTFYKYNENNSFKNPDNTISYQSGWVAYTDVDGLLFPMMGYAANLRANPLPLVFTMSGEVNNGALSLPLENNNREFTKGFNLVGNPYPSPIDWDAEQGWIKDMIDGSIYFFNAGTNRYTGTYTSYVNNMSTGVGDNIIAAMQGFFVHVTDPVSEVDYPVSTTLGMNNSVRTNNLNPVFKRASIDNRPILRFSAKMEPKEAIEDAMVIYFDPLASLKFDKDLDALKMTNSDLLVPNLYTLTPESTELSINGMPEPADSLTRIPLGITTFTDGWIHFKAKDISQLPAEWHLYLADATTGETHDLQLVPDVRFNLKAGAYNQRFTLVFSLSELTLKLEPAEKMFTLTRYGESLLIKTKLPFNTKGQLMVTNILGQQLTRKEVSENETVKVNSNTSTGVFIITLIAGKRKQSEKIVMRKDYE